MPRSKPETDLSQRIATVAAGLTASLGALAEQVLGGALRPSKLVSQLDLDKSLASRLVRALRSTDPYESVHFIPSPTGLRMFVDAAEAAGAQAALLAVARDSIESFQVLLDGFPGGRSALDTWISEGVSEIRDRSDRRAQQAVFKGMSHLLGFHCDAVTSALILQPSADGSLVDGVEVGLRTGVRRVRPDAPAALFSINLAIERSMGPSPRLEPLLEGSDPADPMSYIVDSFCSPSQPMINIFQDQAHTVFALSDDSSSMQTPVTVASALVVRNGWVPFQNGEVDSEGRSYLLHYPCKLLVRDLYLRDDLFVGSQPEVALEFPNPAGSGASRRSELPARLNRLDVWAPLETLGAPARRIGVPRVPAHAPLVAHAFERAGWDPRRFRGYRTRLVYPVPMILVSWAIPLPPRQ